MIEIGENTGSIDEGLLYVADFNEKELERRLEFLSKIIEPALLVIVGGMVAFVYIAFFLGLMAVSRGAGL
jgi:type IV pilus assembly protein PilC